MKTSHSPNRTPHKHAELIKAWADGAEIQYRYHNYADWIDTDNPVWTLSNEYRIKPEPVKIKFRNYLANDGCGVYLILSALSENAEFGCRFVRWVGDWVEVEV